MDLKQSKIILEKINALHKSMSMDENTIAAIERDLMLGYIKQLYEAFLASDGLGNKAEVESSRQREKSQARYNYTPPRIIEIPDSRSQPDPPKPKPEPEREPDPDPIPDPPKPDPAPDPPKREPLPDPEPRPQPRREPDPRPTPQPPPSPNPPQAQQPEVAVANKEELEELFQFQEAKELSEKLSERPVNDLTKALAINDRLLYMNELFGKDLNSLNDTLSLLNKYDNMDEARGLLMNLAEKYDWTKQGRLPAARDFIKLVRRRYSR